MKFWCAIGAQWMVKLRSLLIENILWAFNLSRSPYPLNIAPSNCHDSDWQHLPALFSPC